MHKYLLIIPALFLTLTACGPAVTVTKTEASDPCREAVTYADEAFATTSDALGAIGSGDTLGFQTARESLEVTMPKYREAAEACKG